MVKKIWYPGSAFAPTEWATYLQNTFKGTWYYSDINNFTEWNHLKGVRIKADTLGVLPDKLLNQEFDDPGSQIDEFSSNLENIVIFQSLGYELYKNNIKLPDLKHQYCEFRNYANSRTQGI